MPDTMKPGAPQNRLLPRVAWFSPLPPVPSGIAAYSAEILPLLAGTYDLDVFVELGSPPAANGWTEAAGLPSAPAGCRVRDAHDFLWAHSARPYDAVVYQLGNAPFHDYMWPYIVRYPGLVVFHDGQLHHARARRLLSTGRVDEYRREYVFSHPDVSPSAAEFAAAGFTGTPYYFWPMMRPPLRAARRAAVHSRQLAAELRESGETVEIDVINMGATDPLAALAGSATDPSRGSLEPHTELVSAARARVAARHLLPADGVLFAAFGKITPEKRISRVLNALAGLAAILPSVRLLLVGDPVPHFDVEAAAREHGVLDRVTLTGFVEDRDLPEYLAAADICLSLRWPTSRETSASWVRCLAAGKPTVIPDLAHLADVPSLDPRTWKIRAGSRPGGAPPICVAVDIMDEDHSLALAMRRLALDTDLRRRLGCTAREYWQREHTLERMAADYRAALDRTLAGPAPLVRGLPPHLLADTTSHARRIAERFAVMPDVLQLLDFNRSAN